MYIVGIDMGHGGKDPGAIGKNGNYEKDINLGIGVNAVKYLKKNNIKVITTRTADKYISLSDRTKILNDKSVDVAVSIHCNGYIYPSANYITTLILKKGYEAEKCALKVQQDLVDITGWNDGGIREKQLYILKYTKMPAVLTECGFITNPQQENWLIQPENQKILGKSIAKGVCEYLNVNFKDNYAVEVVISDVAPIVKDGRTMIELKTLVEKILDGKILSWDKKNGIINAKVLNRIITIQVGNPNITIKYN